MQPTILSPHFTLAEMTRSDYALRHGIPNEPNAQQIETLRVLCVEVLEKVRSYVGGPVIVSSGFRSPLVNQPIGGSSTSQHMKGEAADFTIPGMSNLEVIKAIVHAIAVIPFDQLIYEGGEQGWIHISHALAGSQRREVLSAIFVLGHPVYAALEV